jgi:hypothetical protein
MERLSIKAERACALMGGLDCPIAEVTLVGCSLAESLWPLSVSGCNPALKQLTVTGLKPKAT